MPFPTLRSLSDNAQAQYHLKFDAKSSKFLGQELPVAKRMLEGMGLNADTTTVGFARRIETAEECHKDMLRAEYEQGGGFDAATASSAMVPPATGQGDGATEPNFDGDQSWDCIFFDGERGYTIGEHSMSHFEVKVEQSLQADSPPNITLTKGPSVIIVQRSPNSTQSWTLTRHDDAGRWPEMITAWVKQRIQGELKGSENAVRGLFGAWSDCRAEQRFSQAYSLMDGMIWRFGSEITATQEGLASQGTEGGQGTPQTVGQNSATHGGRPASDAYVMSEPTNSTNTSK